MVYRSIDYAKIVGWDVVYGGYIYPIRVARFESESDAKAYVQHWNTDLSAGIAEMRESGAINGSEAGEIKHTCATHTVAVYDIPVIPIGGPAPDEYHADYGAAARMRKRDK